jgi:hypothetical protein
MKTELQELRDALAQGERSIGAFVYWTGLKDVRVDRSLFRQGFRVCGLGGAVQRDPKPEATLNAASNIASRRQGKEELPAYSELKRKSPDWVQYAVIMRRDVGERRGYLEEATITLDRKALEPLPVVAVAAGVQPDEQRDALIDAIVDTYGELRGYVNTEEFSQTLVRAMALMGAITLRSGVYFVPAANMPQAKMLKAFVENSTSAFVATWDIKVTDENAAQAGREARESFSERVTKLVGEVNELVATTSSEDVQMKQVTSKLRKLRDLEGKIDLFADVLDDYAAQLRKSLADARTTMAETYLGDDAEPVADLDDDEAEAA